LSAAICRFPVERFVPVLPSTVPGTNTRSSGAKSNGRSMGRAISRVPEMGEKTAR
jgi:hypothetical protein